MAFERETMINVKREERQKRAEGKGEWYLKKGPFSLRCTTEPTNGYDRG